MAIHTPSIAARSQLRQCLSPARPTAAGSLLAFDFLDTCPRRRLSLDLVLKKETGPTEHKQHQMYLLVYLLEDEAEILRIAATPELLDKSRDSTTKLFLDVLLEKGLVAQLESKVAKRQGFAGQDNRGKYADGTIVGREKEDFLALNTFTFSFLPTYADLFNKVSKLAHFQNEDPPPDTVSDYARGFKMLVYVPVNDCKYATDVREEIRSAHDIGLDGDKLTPILYLPTVALRVSL